MFSRLWPEFSIRCLEVLELDPKPGFLLVIQAVPQGPILILLLFTLFIKDILNFIPVFQIFYAEGAVGDVVQLLNFWHGG
jgi:hypothetical protein